MQVPKSIVIIGGGYIAVEFAGIFAGLGAEVHLVYRQDMPLRGFDEEVRCACCAVHAVSCLHVAVLAIYLLLWASLLLAMRLLGCASLPACLAAPAACMPHHKSLCAAVACHHCLPACLPAGAQVRH